MRSALLLTLLGGAYAAPISSDSYLVLRHAIPALTINTTVSVSVCRRVCADWAGARARWGSVAQCEAAAMLGWFPRRTCGAPPRVATPPHRAAPSGVVLFARHLRPGAARAPCGGAWQR